MSNDVSVTFLRRQGVGGNTYNAGEHAGFPQELAEKLVSRGIAKSYGNAISTRGQKIAEPIRKG